MVNTINSSNGNYGQHGRYGDGLNRHVVLPHPKTPQKPSDKDVKETRSGKEQGNSLIKDKETRPGIYQRTPCQVLGDTHTHIFKLPIRYAPP